jgi:hypothetical protein
VDQEQLLQQVQTISGQPVSSLTLDRLKGDASERNFYRVRFNRQHSQVLMAFDPPQPEKQAQLELVWRYFKSQDLGVPLLYYHDLKRGLLFFEDCGDVTLEQVVHKEPAEVYYPYYEQAIELLLKIQLAGIRYRDPDCPVFQRAFDTEKLCWELDFFLEHMLGDYLKLRLPPEDERGLKEHFLDLCRQLAAEPHYLTHRDYHSRNLMIKDGRIRLVDYQDARLGLCQYDLASLLRDSYVQLSESQVNSLLEYYIRLKQEAEGAVIDRKRFRQIFDYTCIQRSLKAVGTFAYLACQRSKPEYLKFIPNTLKYVRQNLNKYPELNAFRQLLGKYLPEVG